MSGIHNTILAGASSAASSLNQKAQNALAIFKAIENNQTDQAVDLIEKSTFYAEAKNDRGIPLLFYACEHGDVMVINALLANRKLIHSEKNGLTPLLFACSIGRADIVSFLLDIENKFPDFDDSKLKIALRDACQDEHDEIAFTLLNQGITLRENDQDVADQFLKNIMKTKNTYQEYADRLLNAGAFTEPMSIERINRWLMVTAEQREKIENKVEQKLTLVDERGYFPIKKLEDADTVLKKVLVVIWQYERCIELLRGNDDIPKVVLPPNIGSSYSYYSSEEPEDSAGTGESVST
ncbi:MAG: hypothetical protein KR126chlam1_00818 [Chlamydiae bacterium]|nr:hypothetical protein [Chlamydiota bacterium]